MSYYVFDKKAVIYLGFIGKFHTQNEKIKLRISGRTNFIFYVDGIFKGDGPSRFTSGYPQYTTHEFDLEEGLHSLNVLLQYVDFETRLADNKMDPFLFCEIVSANGSTIPVEFKYKELKGFDQNPDKRMAPTLGLMEWCWDSRDLFYLLNNDYDSAGEWNELLPSEGFEIFEDVTRPVLNLQQNFRFLEGGKLTEEFGYERDCEGARFFLRQQDDLKAPAQGIYRRYDMGSVKLVRPCFTLELPKGAYVEIAACEQLAHGRVNPFLSLTGGQGTNLVHYQGQEGRQVIMPLTPLGGRYVELHIICEPEDINKINIIEESYYWRTFFDEAPGRFDCCQGRLSDIWQMSVNTLRSCTEDVVTDCPTRERGQWTGDCSVVGLRTTSVAYGDMQVIRKSLLQASYLPDENGVIPALFPGQRGYFITYSLLWVMGLEDYYKATGDISLLSETYEAARVFMDHMDRCFNRADGSLQCEGKVLDCGFVDWGYEMPRGMVLPVVGMYALALEAFIEISKALERETEEISLRKSEVFDLLSGEASSGDFDRIGYHGTVFLLLTDAIEEGRKGDAISYIKDFVINCFPNNRYGDRLYSPTIFVKNIITPYFYNFTLWALIKNGEAEFAYDQIEKCWGYMLDSGENTCLEVFDHRWSHCHQWSGCPGWILSGFGLGLFKRYDLGQRHFEFDLKPGKMGKAAGVIPLPCGGRVYVSWEEVDKKITYRIESNVEIWVHFTNKLVKCSPDRRSVLVLRKTED